MSRPIRNYIINSNWKDKLPNKKLPTRLENGSIKYSPRDLLKRFIVTAKMEHWTEDEIAAVITESTTSDFAHFREVMEYVCVTKMEQKKNPRKVPIFQ